MIETIYLGLVGIQSRNQAPRFELRILKTPQVAKGHTPGITQAGGLLYRTHAIDHPSSGQGVLLTLKKSLSLSIFQRTSQVRACQTRMSIVEEDGCQGMSRIKGVINRRR